MENALGAAAAAGAKKGQAAPKITVFEDVVQSGFLRTLRSRNRPALASARGAGPRRDLPRARTRRRGHRAAHPRARRVVHRAHFITVLQGKVDASWTELFKKERKLRSIMIEAAKRLPDLGRPHRAHRRKRRGSDPRAAG